MKNDHDDVERLDGGEPSGLSPEERRSLLRQALESRRPKDKPGN